MTTVDYYELLDIDRSADEAAIKKAVKDKRTQFRRLTGSPNREQARRAEEAMDRIGEAEALFADPNRRRAYDRELSQRPVEEPVTKRGDSQASSWIESAKAYLADGQPKNSAAAAREATRAEPDNLEAWILRTYAALELRDVDDADFSASEAVRRHPDEPRVAGLLGDVYSGGKRWADAEHAFARAATLDPTNAYWRARVAWALADQGRSRDAVDYAYGALTEFPDDETAKATYALMLLKDAEAALTHDRDSMYVTNPQQIAHVEERLELVRQVSSMDENVVTAYTEMANLVTKAKKRVFVWPGIKLAAAVAFYVFFLALPFGGVLITIVGMTLGLLLWLAANVGMGWLLVRKVFPTQWAINRRALGFDAKVGRQ